MKSARQFPEKIAFLPDGGYNGEYGFDAERSITDTVM